MDSKKIPLNNRTKLDLWTEKPSQLNKVPFSKIVLVGPTSSGKSLLGKLLAKNLRTSGNEELKSIGLGGTIREFFRQRFPGVQTGTGLMPDHIAFKFIEKKLKESKNFILEGFPKTASQIDNLQKIGKLPEIVFNFNVSKEGAKQIYNGRLSCQSPDCKKIYHNAIEEIKPPKDNKCCDQELKKREEDNDENVFEEKRKLFDKNLKAMIDKFKKLGIRVYDINITSNGTKGGKIRKVRDVLNELIEIMKNNESKKQLVA